MSIGHFERISIERLSKAFGVSAERAQEAQDMLGQMYRQLASLPGENKDRCLGVTTEQQPERPTYTIHNYPIPEFECCLGLSPEACGEVPLRHCDKVKRA